MAPHIAKRFKNIKVSGSDIVILLLSVLLAFILWLVLNMSQDYVSLVEVSVTAQSNIEGYSSESSNSAVFSARCQGTGFNIRRLNKASKKKSVKVFFDPNDFVRKEGDIFVVTSDALPKYVNAILGEKANFESMSTQDLQFRFAKENHKKVPVMPVHQLTFEPQYMAASEMAVQPDSITIYGEPFRIDNIDRVYTENIVLKDLKSSRHGTVAIEKKADVRYSEKSVNYTLDVTRYVEIKETVKISARNFASSRNISIYPSTAEVVYKCVFPLQKDPTGQVSFYIDASDFDSSINGRCVARAANLPSGVISYTVEPQIFEVIESSRK